MVGAKVFEKHIINCRKLDGSRSSSRAAAKKIAEQELISESSFNDDDFVELFTRAMLNGIGAPMCLALIDLKKAFDSVETEAVIEALVHSGRFFPTQYIRVHRELRSGFTAKISPFHNDVVVNNGVRQGNTMPPKFFSATLENVTRELP
ncbi:unnamed protein product [Heligmosomoides polygyrus]|uniref:Reverse transcriptase domain-containing protein n=1 Tax=Heligmosomoides polygyrus TaxID=6339 RepID=A0A183FQZ2_HELPZ|nr:unnamed protein product [Heligmosomoides polygyrus]